MKILVFDPFSGASGDMLLGSLLDLGVDFSKIDDALHSLNLGLRMKVKEEEKRGIVAKKVEFVDEKGVGIEKHKKLCPSSYAEMVRKIEDSGLGKELINNSLSILEIILNAEERVHGKKKEDLILHELSSIDTVADIVANSVAFLDIQSRFRGESIEVISMPISVGGGFVNTEHGILPVPTPVSQEILSSASLFYKGGPFAEELLTPTGAAILAHLVHRSVSFSPVMRVEKIGYGAGSKNLPMPNVLRAMLGRIEETLIRDEIEVLETNVNNVTGEVFGNLTEVLMEEGAKDVAIIPAMMKKGRAGHIIKVITAPQETYRIAHRIMKETGTLGVRVIQIKHRFIADREERKVKVKIKGEEREVTVKIGRNGQGNLFSISAEYEDARKVARELKVPVKEVTRIVEEAARQ